jgi:hypothetical protein
VILPVEAPAGIEAVIEVSLLTSIGAGTPLINTPVAFEKPSPTISMSVPGRPNSGLTEVTAILFCFHSPTNGKQILKLIRDCFN